MTGELVVPVLRVCEDCGGEVEPGVEPIGLMRPMPGAPAGPRRRRGGRRWREYLLCRRCRGDVLRRRSAQNGVYRENGVRKHLLTRDRRPPTKGGRPRLLSDDELRACYRLYEGGRSINDLARLLAEQREKGTFGGYASALFYGFRRLELPTRPPGKAIALARWGTDGTKSKPQKRRCEGECKLGERRGKRCRQWAAKGSRYCVWHDHEWLADWRARRRNDGAAK